MGTHKKYQDTRNPQEPQGRSSCLTPDLKHAIFIGAWQTLTLSLLAPS